MITINKIYVEEQTINKSVFICTLIPIKTNEEAVEELNKLRKKYYDATHNCYAYIYGENGEYARCSDDGEPSQTAGVVILDVLKKNELTNCLAVVTRYFGGIKLGASGLVRAYSSTTGLCVKTIEPLTLRICALFTVTVSYNNYNRILKTVEKYEEKEKEFLENIKITYLIPFEDADDLSKKLIEQTKGQIQINVSKPYSLFL